MNRSLRINRSVVHIFLISLTCILAYSNTMNVPFIFDDIPIVASNPLIRDVGNFFDIGVMNDHRYVGKLTFALNYALHGLDVRGYHLVNLLIHVVNGVLVYLLVVASFRAPGLAGSRLDGRLVGLITALLFVSHPLQTQAVTYIVQRYTSLGTMFYLLGVLGYVRWRLGEGGWWYLVGLVSAVAGMKTKEIVFTLPLVIGLYEVVFFEGGARRFLYVLPFVGSMVLVPLSFIGKVGALGELVEEVERVTSVEEGLGRWQYILTEVRVLVSYLRLVFLPVGQNLDYDYRVSEGMDWEVLGSGVVLGVLLVAGVVFGRGRWVEGRLVGFGLLWFFVCHLVEGFLVVLPDVIFEHRMYLPMYGVVVAVVVLVVWGAGAVGRQREAVVVMMLVVLVLVVMSYRRNQVWTDEVRLWQDVVSKSPNKARAYNNLGYVYSERGWFQEAEKAFKKALQLRPDHPGTHYNLGNLYLSMGQLDMAIEEYQKAIALKPDYIEAHNNLAIAYKRKGMYEKAVNEYQTVLRLNPQFAVAHYNLANLYFLMGRIGDARRHYQEAHRLNPSLSIPVR